jgi:hypothetical protein
MMGYVIPSQGEEVDAMRRRLRLKLRADRTLFAAAQRAAGEAFSEQRYHDALAIYEKFAQEHPGAHEEDIQLRIRALRNYITEHVEKAGHFPPHIAD